jgi:hypothetical protein
MAVSKLTAAWRWAGSVAVPHELTGQRIEFDFRFRYKASHGRHRKEAGK